MPRYSYECEDGLCVAVESHFFAMGSAPSCVNCSACGKIARRVFTAPQLTTQPALLSDANKRGLAEMDSKAKVEDKAYNKRWDRRLQSL